ncbi:class I SAM-dependent methyltransferase [Stieleria sp. TO1_6]|uniref:class I SAM-dependent methyltransferase n=1 Tax=Stieleria tagensis TaxID=2956795 RepID=UPI00209AAC42|nr:class I SAM-dependent methyltransferase [Stieleria tagensis]MCO8120560.1 class I SAM-dependent methyltransferase [Stieleria tagensis]
MNSVGQGNDAGRVRWIESQLSDLSKGARILDAGAGEQRFRPCCDHLEYVSQDFGEYNPEQKKQGLQMEKWSYGKLDHVCDISDVPEPDHSFDAILCTEVFEHLPDPLSAIREFSRLLRPGGKLLLTAPFVSLTHFAPYHFATGFNRYFYETHLGACGFQIDDISPNGNFFELVAQEVRRVGWAGSHYSGQRMRPWEKLARKVMLRMLERFSRNDQGSTELACYGLQVVATYRPNAQQMAA